MGQGIHLRKIRENDLQDVVELISRNLTEINSKDYNKGQLILYLKIMG